MSSDSFRILAVMVAAAAVHVAASTQHSDHGGTFDQQTEGTFPNAWVSTSTRPILPATVSAPGAFGSSQSLLLTSSNPRMHQGASIWHPLPTGTSPLEVNLSFAFGGGTGRAVKIWTADEKSPAPTHLNLTIENRRLRQFHPLFHQWMDIGGELTHSPDPKQPVWYRLRMVIPPRGNSIAFWLSGSSAQELPDKPVAVLPAYRSGELSRLHVVVEQPDAFIRLDDVSFRIGGSVAAPPSADPPRPYYQLWSGPPIPETQDQLQPPDVITNVVLHAPRDGQYTFLHGAAIVDHKSRLFANWANSPVHENSPDESLQGSSSSDGGLTWAPREVIARPRVGDPNFSHTAFLSRNGELWIFAARFRGLREEPGLKFPDLQVEALVLDEKTNTWKSRGTVARDMWPYVQPIQLPNGNWITAGQGLYGEPGVLISHGGDLTKWRTIRIPVAKDMPQGFGETSLLQIGRSRELLALVRPGSGTRVAWASVSKDNGETWSETQPTNFPIGLSKMYSGRLSTGQPYVVANFPSRGVADRDTLVIAVGRSGADTVDKLYQVRFGPTRPIYSGFAKGAQWSYPYAHEHDGKLYIVYSVNKEECGLSIIPVSALTGD
jgi:hypothetical protein